MREPLPAPTTGSAISVSVVIPVFNEAEVLPELLRRLTTVLSETAADGYEILFVDDGSSDSTGELLKAAGRTNDRVRWVRLSRNFGHQPAIRAGLAHATGARVVVMDGDLQDPPEDIPRLLGRQLEGFDVVFARRTGRKEGPLLRMAYYTAYRLASLFSSVPLPLDAGDFAVLSRRTVDELLALPERQAYLRGLRAWVGFRQTGIDVERGARYAGRPKYGTRALFRLAFDGLFAFTVAPLRLAGVLGLTAVCCSAAYGLYAIVVKLLLDQSPVGFTGLIVSLVFIGGVQLFFLGVIGEYVGRIYQEVKRRPHYLVAETSGESNRRGLNPRTEPPGAPHGPD